MPGLLAAIRRIFSGKIKKEGIYHNSSYFGYEVIKNEEKEKAVPLRVDFKPEIIPTEIYTRLMPPQFDTERINTSIGIYGSAGCGKTKVSLSIVEAQLFLGQKFHIISVKPYDHWLSLQGFKIVNVKKGAPNPFLHNIEILIDSVVLAISSIGMQGINANAIESIMRKACNPAPKNWGELLKRLEKMKKDTDLGAAFESLLLKLEQYAQIPILDNFLIEKENTIFNFEGLTNDPLRFWANMVMSVAYEKMQSSENRDLVLVIDEAHMIIPADPEAASHSIINQIARMGRAFGSFFIISQMMSDIPYFIRENVGMIFCFGTQSALELGLVPDWLMKWTLQLLQQHEFIDLKVNYGTLVPVLRFYEAENQESVENTNQKISSAPEQETPKVQKKTAVNEDDVLEYLDSYETSPYARRISNDLAEKFVLNKDQTSLRCSKLLVELVKNGTISKDKVEDYWQGSNKDWILYCPANSDKLHVWMCRRVLEEMKSRTNLEIQYVSEGAGESGHDIELKNFVVEIETGKMNDDENLMKRVSSSVKNVIIIIPNLEVKNEYLKKQYTKSVEILTLREFIVKFIITVEVQ